MTDYMNNREEQFFPFSTEELDEGIKTIKLGKASGLDGITAEMIHNFGPKTRQWLLELLNTCVTTLKIPKT